MRLRVEDIGRGRGRRAARCRNLVDPRGRSAELQLEAVLKSKRGEMKVKEGERFAFPLVGQTISLDATD